MDRLQVILIVLAGVVSCFHKSISASLLEVTVRPGDNITLYCDCRVFTGVYIVWFRNCSHDNQPSLVISVKNHFSSENSLKFPRLTFQKNTSSDSYDLVIINVTKSDEGLYYCGTEETMVVNKKCISVKEVHRSSNTITKLTVHSRRPDSNRGAETTLQDGGLCNDLPFALTLAVVSVFFTLLTSVLVCLLSWKRSDVKKIQGDIKRDGTMGQTEGEQAEHGIYAALEMHESSQRPKKKKTSQSSDLCTYSTVRYTSGLRCRDMIR